MLGMRLDGIGSLVTGASSGIGRATAVALGHRGGRVALLARRGAELERVAGEVEAAGGAAAAFPVDVADPAGLEVAVARAAAWADGLRLVVVNAGSGLHGAAETATGEQIRRVVAVNLLGSIETVRAALPHLRRAAPATLVGVGSLMGLIPIRGGGTYGATKAGFLFYLQALRLELAGSGVGVGWVCPASVRTEMFADVIASGKLPRLARWLVPPITPERVAAAVLDVARRGGGRRVIPATAAFFAAFARTLPRTAERVLLLTGAGDP